MPYSVIAVCAGCGIAIDPQDEAVELIEEQRTTIGRDTGATVIPIAHYAHDGHEYIDLARGYRETGRGKLDDLRDRRRQG